MKPGRWSRSASTESSKRKDLEPHAYGCPPPSALLQERIDDRAAMSFPPDFSQVEACLLPVQREENGPCGDKFSNPKFFENQWIKEQEQRMQ